VKEQPRAAVEPPDAPALLLRRAPEGPEPLPLVVARMPYRRPFSRPGAHAHRFLQMIYVEGGSGSVRADGPQTGVGPGDLFVFAPNQAHDFELDEGVDAWMLSVSAEIAEATPGMSLRLSEEMQARWSRRITTLEDELRVRRSGYRELAQHELAAMFIELRRVAPPPPLTPKVSPLAARLVELVERDYAEPLTLVGMARALRRSPAYLTNLARTELGRTAMQLVLDRRMRAARERLLGSDEMIDVIAERVGFADPAYFTRVFRREHGTAPQRWRQLQRGRT